MMKNQKVLDLLMDICGEGDYVAFQRLGVPVPKNVPLEAFEHLHHFESSFMKLVTCMFQQATVEQRLNRR